MTFAEWQAWLARTGQTPLRFETYPEEHTRTPERPCYYVSRVALADGRIVLFFDFQDADTGITMIIPGVRGQGDMARFHVTGGLTDPQKN